MRHPIRPAIRIVAALLCILGASLAVAVATDGLTVQVKKGQVRERPTYLSKVLAEAPYGQAVTMLEQQGDWRRVTTGGQEGWMHKTAVATPESALVAQAQQKATGASRGEMALAGKGFSKSMEDSFRAKNTHLDYTWLDKMETIVVPAESLRTFVTEGDLSLAAREDDGGGEG